MQNADSPADVEAAAFDAEDRLVELQVFISVESPCTCFWLNPWIPILRKIRNRRSTSVRSKKLRL